MHSLAWFPPKSLTAHIVRSAVLCLQGHPGQEVLLPTGHFVPVSLHHHVHHHTACAQHTHELCPKGKLPAQNPSLFIILDLYNCLKLEWIDPAQLKALTFNFFLSSAVCLIFNLSLFLPPFFLPQFNLLQYAFPLALFPLSTTFSLILLYLSFLLLHSLHFPSS